MRHHDALEDQPGKSGGIAAEIDEGTEMGNARRPGMIIHTDRNLPDRQALPAGLGQNLDLELEPAGLDLRNPLATNPAFFYRAGSPVVQRLLSSLDLVTLLQISLISLGLSRITTRLSFRKAFALVMIPWGIYTAATVLLPFLF